MQRARFHAMSFGMPADRQLESACGPSGPLTPLNHGAFMKHTAFTVLILLLALACYGLGMVKSLGLVLALGIGLEAWFWVRALRRSTEPINHA